MFTLSGIQKNVAMLITYCNLLCASAGLSHSSHAPVPQPDPSFGSYLSSLEALSRPFLYTLVGVLCVSLAICCTPSTVSHFVARIFQCLRNPSSRIVIQTNTNYYCGRRSAILFLSWAWCQTPFSHTKHTP